ncbi:MAG: uncharacterized protein QG670_1571 [Thermoproteota archaeon]|nr:uncharacterized protein [Thermoproteota archaeon]
MKFVVDEMLGRSARWLRLLGCEVKYFKASDDKYLEIAEKEDRILLTRDLELFHRAKSRGLEAFYVEGEDEAEKLANISRRFNIKLEINTLVSRCPKCNSIIKRVGKVVVLNNVPKRAFEHYDEFWLCLGCGKIYWQGGHWKKINETLARAQELLKTKMS